MHRRRVALLAVLAALCAATWTSTAIAASARGCGLPGYGYAGVASGAAVRGVGATVSALVRPRVQSGHVAAWVGVGGYGMGPGGRDEWLQLGIATSRQFTQRVYVEWARPGKRPRLVVVESGLAVGETRRLAVLELAGRRFVVAGLRRRAPGGPGRPPSRQPRPLPGGGDRRELGRRPPGVQPVRLPVLRAGAHSGRVGHGGGAAHGRARRPRLPGRETRAGDFRRPLKSLIVEGAIRWSG